MEEEAKLELRQYLWIHTPLDMAVEQSAWQEDDSGFNALLEHPDVDAIKVSETMTVTGDNERVAGDISEKALCASLRFDMTFCYFLRWMRGKNNKTTNELVTP